MTIKELVKKISSRSSRWHKDGQLDWTVLEWSACMAGEAGEACNVAKKLRRLQMKMASINKPGRHFTSEKKASRQVGLEAADTIIYAMILASKAGQDIEECIREVFNQKSEEYGFPERL